MVYARCPNVSDVLQVPCPILVVHMSFSQILVHKVLELCTYPCITSVKYLKKFRSVFFSNKIAISLCLAMKVVLEYYDSAACIFLSAEYELRKTNLV
uniref:Ovule protein n=1 Tax=Heterorhabditis bacteriophora TaxID=37862 RepID=A0A1I7WAL2_HETBA